MVVRLDIYIGIIIVCASVYCTTTIFTKQPSAVMTVNFLDVGQGDAALIQVPNGITVLIDGGPNESLHQTLSLYIPWYRREISIVVASHFDFDHIGGLPSVLKRYWVSALLHPDIQDSEKLDPTVVSLLNYADQEYVNHISVRSGTKIILDPNLKIELEVFAPFEVLDPKDSNANSIVAKLTYNNISFLFTGDAPVVIEDQLVQKYGHKLQSNVLKVAHHGSDTSSSDTFLNFVKPQFAIISAGKDNSFGHPHQVVSDRITGMGITILETSKEKTISFKTDGQILYRN